MKKIKLLIIPFMTFLLFGFTPMSGMNTTSLEWQKIELEKLIKDQVVSTISPIIRSGEYIVNVTVNMRDGSGVKPASGGGGGDKGGKDKDKEKDKDKKPEPSVKFNDIDPKDAKGDYIVMSKLGLEAPLYQESAPIIKEGAPVPKPDDGAKSEAQQWQKFLTDYMNNYDLFKLIETVTVDVKLDNYLGDETKKTVEDLLNNMSLQFGTVKAKVQISFIDIKEMKKDLDKRKDNQRREMFEWLGKLGQPAGIIIAVILLGVFAFIIFKKYAALQEKQMEMMKDQMTQQKNEQANKRKEEDEEKKDSAELAGQVGASESLREDGIERFRAMFQNNPMESSLMIKRWIKEPTKMNQLILNVLVKELSGDELAKLFENITLDERKTWKRFIGKALKPEDIVNAKRAIGAQVVHEMIMPNSITDSEAVEMLIRINPEESANFCQEEPKLASILMSVMNAKFLSKMMDKLPDEVVQLLLQESFSLNTDKINSMLTEFKAKISKHIKTETVSPFMEKLVELIPLSSPQRERTLYQGLAQGGTPEKILELARNFFPSELIFSIPDQMLKSFVQAFPREKRPELVLILDGEVKQKFIDIIAPNEKSRDMLTLDLEKFETDTNLKKKVLDNKDTLMKEFIDHCRKQIRSNPSHLKDLEPVLSIWMTSLGVTLGSQKENANLRLAA